LTAIAEIKRYAIGEMFNAIYHFGHRSANGMLRTGSDRFFRAVF
jgi:hypothetical protein